MTNSDFEASAGDQLGAIAPDFNLHYRQLSQRSCQSEATYLGEKTTIQSNSMRKKYLTPKEYHFHVACKREPSWNRAIIAAQVLLVCLMITVILVN